MQTIEAILRQAQQQLIAEGLTDSPQLDAEILLGHALGKDRTYLFTWPEKTLSENESNQFQVLLDKRLAGHPIAHITATREFWELALKVTADTLIPRPDTETLVAAVLELPLADNATVLDMGTGTGAIALALKSERATWQISALDQSPKALAVAQENAHNLNLTIQLLQSDWFSALNSQKFDCIVSNPPYIEEQDPHLSQGDVRFEPLSALTSGPDGLDDIRFIIKNSVYYLQPKGWLLFEHGYNQSKAIQSLLAQNGFENIKTIKDFGDNDRVTLGQLGNSQLDKLSQES